jgi:hypothetical protein
MISNPKPDNTVFIRRIYPQRPVIQTGSYRPVISYFLQTQGRMMMVLFQQLEFFIGKRLTDYLNY